jgi:hypothetical protein
MFHPDLGRATAVALGAFPQGNCGRNDTRSCFRSPAIDGIRRSPSDSDCDSGLGYCAFEAS